MFEVIVEVGHAYRELMVHTSIWSENVREMDLRLLDSTNDVGGAAARCDINEVWHPPGSSGPHRIRET